MSEKIVQLNVRVPRRLARALRVAAASLEVSAQQLAREAFEHYYGADDAGIASRRQAAVHAARDVLSKVELDEGSSLNMQTSASHALRSFSSLHPLLPHVSPIELPIAA